LIKILTELGSIIGDARGKMTVIIPDPDKPMIELGQDAYIIITNTAAANITGHGPYRANEYNR
jgi:hypothetical protein